MCPAQRNDDGQLTARVAALLTAFSPVTTRSASPNSPAAAGSRNRACTGSSATSPPRACSNATAPRSGSGSGCSRSGSSRCASAGWSTPRARTWRICARPPATRCTSPCSKAPRSSTSTCSAAPTPRRCPRASAGAFPRTPPVSARRCSHTRPSPLWTPCSPRGCPRRPAHDHRPGLFRKQLTKIRSDGIAYEREESRAGVICAASPLLNHAGTAVAAISITGWSTRMRADRVAPAVRTAALALSRTLFARPEPLD